MHIFSVGQDEKKKFKLEPFSRISALSAVAVRVTRSTVRDLLVLGANHNLCLLIHGLQEVPLSLDICDGLGPVSPITALRPWSQTRAILTFEDGKETAFHVDLIPSDQLTRECLEILALVLPAELFFQFHHSFLLEWSLKRFAPSGDVEFTVLSNILYSLFSIEATRPPSEDDAWVRLGSSQSHFRGSEDPAMRFLNPPPSRKANVASGISKSRAMVAPILSAFHHLAESHRLKIDRLDSLFKLVPVICHLAVQVRPEWVDYWRRLVPGAVPNWPTQENIGMQPTLHGCSPHGSASFQMSKHLTTAFLCGLQTRPPFFSVELHRPTSFHHGSAHKTLLVDSEYLHHMPLAMLILSSTYGNSAHCIVALLIPACHNPRSAQKTQFLLWLAQTWEHHFWMPFLLVLQLR